MKARFFKTAGEFGKWLERNHDRATEIWVGYYKTKTGRPSITWPESVDQALRFGWIDGVRRSIDDDSYTNRFTPRRARSNWSARNIQRVRELTEAGLMHPAGLKAFEARTEGRSGPYSYEQRYSIVLDPEYERRFRRNKEAWAFFEARAPSYRTAAVHWVMSAKRAETRDRRLGRLIEDSAAGRTVPPLTPRRAGRPGGERAP